ncbi:MAG: hypothetical protein P1U34_04575 [Coxiellaceae bacterium]|nr:hypothetical protein [Coxiellaceae bacterium]
MKDAAPKKDKFLVKKTKDKSWVCYTDIQDVRRPPDQSRGYWHKIRINIPRASYTSEIRMAIKQYIFQYMAKDYKSADKVVFAFKYARTAIQTAWEGERFTDNGQFTIYLLEPANPDKLHNFITGLQAYLTGHLHLHAANPMSTDYAVCNTANISMRLERTDGKYCNSSPIHDHEPVRDAYLHLMRDTRRYASFATRSTVTAFRSEEFDDAHQLLCRGYQNISTLKPAPMLVGDAYQQLALIKRKMLNIRKQTDVDIASAITELLATYKGVIISAVESIKVQSALRIRPIEDDAFQHMLNTDSDFGEIVRSAYEKPAKEAFQQWTLEDDRLYRPGTNILSDASYINLVVDRLYVNCSYPHHAGTLIDYRSMSRDILTILNEIRNGNEEYKAHMAVVSRQPGVEFVISRLLDPTAKAYLSCLHYRAIREQERIESGSDHHKGMFNLFQSEAFRAPTKLSAINKLIDRFEKPGVNEPLTENESKAITTKRMHTLVSSFDLLNPAAVCYNSLTASVSEYKTPTV